jgi:hypothetical protein
MRLLNAQGRAERNQLGSFLRPLGYNLTDLDSAERFALFELALANAHRVPGFQLEG